MDRLGVSIGFLRKFASKVDDKKTTTDVCNEIVIPETKDRACAYIALLEGLCDENGVPYVGEATVFVSHAWKYNFSIPLDVMMKHAEENPGSYFWFDLFINNQNVASNLPYTWWTNTFQSSIESIGSVLLVLSPWNDPIPLTRAWCLFEILCSIRAKTAGVQLHIALPSQEKIEFSRGIASDFECVLKALTDIQAEKAQAFKPTDRENIFTSIRDTVGFETLNEEVKTALRTWFLNTCIDAAETILRSSKQPTPEFALLISNLGLVMESDFGKVDEAIVYHQKSVDIISACSGRLSASTFQCILRLGQAYSQNGEFANAEMKFQQCLKILEELPDQNKELRGAVLYAMGLNFDRSGRHDQSLTCFLEELEISLALHGEMSKETASSYSSVGNAYSGMNDHENALLYYEKDLQVTLQIKGPRHLHTARTYNNIGQVHSAEGRLDEALECFNKDLSITIDTLGRAHPDVAISYASIGQLEGRRGNYSAALASFRDAREIALAAFGHDHPLVAQIDDDIRTTERRA